MAQGENGSAVMLDDELQAGILLYEPGGGKDYAGFEVVGEQVQFNRLCTLKEKKGLQKELHGKKTIKTVASPKDHTILLFVRR